MADRAGWELLSGVLAGQPGPAALSLPLLLIGMETRGQGVGSPLARGGYRQREASQR